MQFSEIPQFYVSAETSVHQSTLIEAKQTEVIHNTRTKDEDIPVSIVFLAHVSFVIVGYVFLLIISKILQLTQDKNSRLNIEHLKPYSCKRCRFFNNNNYLKCAVNPSVVLTKQALNCSDYQPH